MQTTTTRPPRARKQTAAPISTAAARMIEQIQAEARAQLLVELSAKDVITVLHGFDAETKRIRSNGQRIGISDAKGNELTLYKHNTEPEQWRGHAHMAGYWHPARWYGHQQLTDANGVKWRREFEPLVCNDFGDLVEVPA
ncbi:MAG: hypothetical protein RL710_1145 [Pseudomonadota bacterium]